MRRKGTSPKSETPIKRKISTRSRSHSNNGDQVNKRKDEEKIDMEKEVDVPIITKRSKQTKKGKKMNNQDRIAATVVEEDQILITELDAQQEMEFQGEDHDDDIESGIVQFNTHSRRPTNNNSSVGRQNYPQEQNIRMEEGELSEDNTRDVDSDDSEVELEVMEIEESKDKFKQDVLDEAMNRFHEIFMSSGFMQTTADMVEKKILEAQPNNSGK